MTSMPRRLAASSGRRMGRMFSSLRIFIRSATAQPDEIACNAKKLDEANKSKVKAQIFTQLLYRHWNAYKEGKRSHIFVICFRF